MHTSWESVRETLLLSRTLSEAVGGDSAPAIWWGSGVDGLSSGLELIVEMDWASAGFLR